MKTVIVAMSGGVDSAVTAALLKEEGYRVIGVTLQLLPPQFDSNGDKKCCGIRHIEDAKNVSSVLQIPHYVFNMRIPFKEYVINNFIQEYLGGRTPNPCIRCNKFIKFQILLDRAQQIGADYIATGHYARICYNERKNIYVLMRGIDSLKDQSYFLYELNQEQMKHILMPLGKWKKSDVRKKAKELNLSVHDKNESQEVCFVPGRDYREIFSRFNIDGLKRGPIIDINGNVLGEHNGIMNYTIGQRRGLNISSNKALYVIKILPEKNTIVVGPRECGFSNVLLIRSPVWLYGKPRLPRKVFVKIRSVHKPAKALIKEINQNLMVEFEEPQWAITPGQSAVFYEEDIVLGGGVIEAKNEQ